MDEKWTRPSQRLEKGDRATQEFIMRRGFKQLFRVPSRGCLRVCRRQTSLNWLKLPLDKCNGGVSSIDFSFTL